MQAMARGKSILSEEKQCFICNSTMYLECHHVFNGANRTKSDEDGCWCWLCSYHHRTGNHAVHKDADRARWLKRYTQRRWEERYMKDHESDEEEAREAFLGRYRKSYQ